MPAPKPPLSILDQIALLVQRGLEMSDADTIPLARLLTDNSYARLARYWRYAQIDPTHGNKTFIPGTTVSSLADAYMFDSGLRHLMSDGLEVFEITLRSRLGYFMAEAGAAYLYRDAATYRTTMVGTPARDARNDLLDDIERDLGRSREDFITTAIRRGNTPPLWDAMEVLSLGSVSKMYSLLADMDVCQQIAKSFGYPNVRFALSVFRSLTVVRNICAHHARVWNRTSIQVAPAVLNKLKTDPDQGIYQSTPWACLVVLADIVDTIRRNNDYSQRLLAFIDAHPEYADGLKHPKNAR